MADDPTVRQRLADAPVIDPFRDANGYDADFGREAGDPGWLEAPDWSYAEPANGREAKPGPAVRATPYRWCQPESLPRRPWILGRQLLRGAVFVVVAPGATGKSALMAGTALALCTGRDFMGHQVWGGPKRVWLWNLEDAVSEISFSIQAAALHWDIGEADIADHLFVDSGLDGATLRLASSGPAGAKVNADIASAIADEIASREIDVLIVDPFVSSHGLADENDNAAVDAVAKEWARIAATAGCAIVLVHHSRKLDGQEATAESSRGASSLTDAVRGGLALNTMSKKQADELGIEERERRRYFRADDIKPNRAPPGGTQWYHLVSVHLGNGHDGGDCVGVVAPWSVPDPFDDVSLADLRRVQSRIDERGWRESRQASDWFGHLVAQVLELDTNSKSDRAKLRSIIKTWIANDAFRIEERQDAKREMRKFVILGQPV